LINPFLTKPNYIRIFGHRGARGDIVENSISGFKYTFDLGIRAVEFDVVISKDDIPVLFHDYRLNPDLVKDASGNWITDKNMKLVDLTYEEISKYNIESIKPDTKHA
jgi:glycerophosphoryl diester phosphodiesterase